MKKAFHILAIAAMLTSCSSTEYKISGIAEEYVDGDSIELGYSIYGKDFTTVDKTAIKNGKFQFTGNIDGCKIYYIVYENDEKEIVIPFFLESGEISVELTKNNGRVTGTEANDINTAFKDTLEKNINAIYSIQETLHSDTLLSDSARSVLTLAGYELHNNSMIYIKKIIRENIKSIVGLYLLVQFSDLFDDTELEELEKSIPEENYNRDNNSLYDILNEIILERKNSHIPSNINAKEKYFQ